MKVDQCECLEKESLQFHSSVKLITKQKNNVQMCEELMWNEKWKER